MRKLLLLLIALFIWLIPATSYAAIANPDSMTIQNLKGYKNLLEVGDILFTTEYNITYATPPASGIDDNFLAILSTPAGTVLSTVQPVSYKDKGYNDGLISFYFDAAKVTSLGIVWESTYNLSLQGNPTQFASPPSQTSSSITYRGDPSGRFWLTKDIRNTLLDLEDSWGDDLLNYSPEGLRATVTGQEYITRAITDLEYMAPDLMSSVYIDPAFDERVFTNTEADNLKDFWQGTTFDTSMDSLAESVGVDRMVLSTILLLVLCGVITFYMVKMTDRTEFGLLTVAIVIPMGAVIGLTDMKFAAVLAMVGILGTGYVFFYKSA